MKTLLVLFSLTIITYYTNIQEEKESLIINQEKKIEHLQDSIQEVNEKRGRLYLTLMLKDNQKYKEEVDSLMYLIGLDN